MIRHATFVPQNKFRWSLTPKGMLRSCEEARGEAERFVNDVAGPENVVSISEAGPSNVCGFSVVVWYHDVGQVQAQKPVGAADREWD